MDLSFRPAASDDLPLLERWFAAPHISAWLHGEGLSNTRASLDAFWRGAPSADHWIALDGKRPFAYLITGAVDPTDSAYRKVPFAGEYAHSLDVFIGEANYLGRGIGSRMIPQFLSAMLPGATDFIIDPEASNTRAVHVYEKIGFRTVDGFIAPWHPVPHLLMHLPADRLAPPPDHL